MNLTEVLEADRPWPGHEKAMALYGRLVGVWDVLNHYLDTDGEWKRGTVVWTFGWVLGGHTVQDVMWFTKPGPDGYPQRITGSTVRQFDPVSRLWRIVWFSPAGTVTQLTGQEGEDGDIVQEGTSPDGRPVRWLFTEVTETSFRWQGYISDDGGLSWDRNQEMLARRR